MTIRKAVLTAIFVGAMAAMGRAEKPKDEPPCNCPLFTIYEWPPDYLYYCDYFATTCGDWTDVGYHFGSFATPVPWQLCGDHCGSPQFRPSKPFPGLATKMPLDYMPVRPDPMPSPIPPNTPTKFPNAPVNTGHNNHFVKFEHNGWRYAKVIEYRFKKSLSDAHWESKYVALECVKPADGQRVDNVHEFGDVKLGKCSAVKRGRINVGGKSEVVLILLVGQEESGKK